MMVYTDGSIRDVEVYCETIGKIQDREGCVRAIKIAKDFILQQDDQRTVTLSD
jgi:hypothetical protein